MLNKPYKFVTQIDNNKYYVIETQEHPYIAIESVLEVHVGKRTSELQQGLKLIPMNTPITMLLLAVRELQLLDKDKFNPVYEELNPENVLASLRNFRQVVEDARIDDELPFDVFDRYEQGQTNNVILSLEHNGFNRLYSAGASGLPVHGRTTWLYKTNTIGGLALVEVTTVGKDDPYNNVVAIQTHVLGVQLVDKIMKKMEHEHKRKQAKEAKKEEKLT